jgi:hypothetical protein
VWSALAFDILGITRIQRFSLQILLTTSAMTANLEMVVMEVLCFDSLQYLIFPVNLYQALHLLYAVQQPPVGQGLRLRIIEASRSHSDTQQSVGLLWTSDQPDAETSS